MITEITLDHDFVVKLNGHKVTFISNGGNKVEISEDGMVQVDEFITVGTETQQGAYKIYNTSGGPTNDLYDLVVDSGGNFSCIPD